MLPLLPDSNTSAPAPKQHCFPPLCPVNSPAAISMPGLEMPQIPTPCVSDMSEQEIDGAPCTPPRKHAPPAVPPGVGGWQDSEIPEWLSKVPLSLRRRLVWARSHNTPIEDETIILLFVGKDDSDALDNILKDKYPELKSKVFAIDTKRCNRTHDFLGEEPYFSLCTAAVEGKLPLIGGGPMCRTFTVKRLIQKDDCRGMVCRGTGTALQVKYSLAPFPNTRGGKPSSAKETPPLSQGG